MEIMTTNKIKHPRRHFLKKLAVSSFIASAIPPMHLVTGEAWEDPQYLLNNDKKIDVHTHISSDAVYLREVMDDLNLKMLTICNEGLKSDRLEAQRKAAIVISEKYPRYYTWCTTFDLNGTDSPGWSNRVIGRLKEDFERGALAVKVWKEIGMQLKNKDGNFIQIDHPVFEPVLDFISSEKKPLFMHIGDPVEYWLSTGADGLPDAWYAEGNDVWNRIGKFRGEVSYDTLMHARDRIIKKYSELMIVGCHMGSMAFDVDLIAERLDKFPNFAVETSFTIPDLMGQSREMVRAFFMEYQDRILYGSDISGGLVATPFLVDMSKINERWSTEEISKLKQELYSQYEHDFYYFATDQEFQRKNYKVRGLALPEDVIQKLFFDNAVFWVPGIEKAF